MNLEKNAERLTNSPPTKWEAANGRFAKDLNREATQRAANQRDKN